MTNCTIAPHAYTPPAPASEIRTHCTNTENLFRWHLERLREEPTTARPTRLAAMSTIRRTQADLLHTHPTAAAELDLESRFLAVLAEAENALTHHCARHSIHPHLEMILAEYLSATDNSTAGDPHNEAFRAELLFEAYLRWPHLAFDHHPNPPAVLATVAFAYMSLAQDAATAD